MKHPNDQTPPDRTPSVALVGFMGAGKTTVGRALAARLGFDFVDLDVLIEEFSGREIRAIIDEDGEAIFRLVETDVLRLLLEAAHDRKLVLATGGGTWMRERNRDILGAHGFVTVWLDADFEDCWRRITRDRPDARPLARSREQARRRHLDRRETYALATLRVRVDETGSVEDIADEIRAKFAHHVSATT